MDDHADRFVSMNVAATSPDGSVTATFSYHDGVRVTLHPRRARDHDENGLAEQVALAIGGVREGRAEIVRRALPRLGADPVERERRRARRDRSLGDITVEATSPRRRVLLRITGAGRVHCVIPPEALAADETELAELAEDIREAYRVAGAEHRRAVNRVNGKLLRRYVRGGPREPRRVARSG